MNSMLPLKDVLVVAVEQIGSAPLCTRTLAEFGARVIRVERPGLGDLSRQDRLLGPWSTTDLWVNASKESVTLNIKHPKAIDVLTRLIERADIVVENLKPGVAQEIGLSYELLREKNHRLVYCRISGFGPDGPYAQKATLDFILQGEGGLIGVTGTPEAPARVGSTICDSTAAIYAAFATTMALMQARQTGVGQLIDLSMLESTAWMLAVLPFRYWYKGGDLPERSGARHQLSSPNGVYDTADGQIIITAPSDSMWAKFCQIIGRPELADDARFATTAPRMQNRRVVDSLIEPILRQRPSSEWIEMLDAAEIPCGVVRGVDQVVDHPQFRNTGFIGEYPSEHGPIKLFHFPARFDGRYQTAKSLPPAIGEHTNAILAEIGYDDAEIEAMRQAGVI